MEKLSEKFVEQICDYIEDAEVLIPIEEFFKEGRHITKKEYGSVLIKYLVQSIKEKFVFKQNSDGWVKCKDRLPEEGKKVLCIHDTYGLRVGCAITDRVWSLIGGSSVLRESITHWRELPAPPIN